MNTAIMPLPYTQDESDSMPLDVSEEECDLTENEVDMLMDALDDDDDASTAENNVDESPVEKPSGTELRYSFSLPLEEAAEADDATSEPADEPIVAPSAGIPEHKVLRKRVKQDEEESSSSKSVKTSPGSAKKDEWDETRAVSHLLLSPYDASFGLLSRVDTR